MPSSSFLFSQVFDNHTGGMTDPRAVENYWSKRGPEASGRPAHELGLLIVQNTLLQLLID